jgi:uncharacterized protein (DUF362 family)
MSEMDRRRFLQGTLAASLSALAGSCRASPSWDPSAYQKGERSQVAILASSDYGSHLVDLVGRGLRLLGTPVAGKRVVLKPNLVEFDPAGVINTHPALIEAAADALLGLGAREVIVAEGPGHRRDNEYVLTASGLHAILREKPVRYVDLNYDDTRLVALRSRFTDLGQLRLPQTVLDADLLVSMPKLKTHHWAGVTLSMKNLFGIVPGAIYGWPKNLLHWAGLPGSILDINSSLSVPRLAIVDGIVGMEGNGPIQGEPRSSGVVVMGGDLVAVDATCARLMGIDPHQVDYLDSAGRFLGNVAAERIAQIGEQLDGYRQQYRLLASFERLRA